MARRDALIIALVGLLLLVGAGVAFAFSRLSVQVSTQHAVNKIEPDLEQAFTLVTHSGDLEELAEITQRNPELLFKVWGEYDLLTTAVIIDNCEAVRVLLMSSGQIDHSQLLKRLRELLQDGYSVCPDAWLEAVVDEPDEYRRKVSDILSD